MEAFIQCDHCQLEFNHYDRQARLFPKCGHTHCLTCINSQKDTVGQEVVVCQSCG